MDNFVQVNKQMSDAISNYLNTLIFCIIAKAVTLLLLILLLFDIGMTFSYAIITVEIGLVAIIAYTLYKVYAFQAAIDAAAAAASTAPPFLNTCPDYFVRSIQPETGDQVCSSKYTTSDGKKTYEFTTGVGGAAIADQDMSAMMQGNKAMSTLCNAQQNAVSGFSWTDLKSRCGFLDTLY